GVPATSPVTSPAQTTDAGAARGQADQVEALLNSSGSSRASLAGALTAADDCTNLSSAVDVLDRVAQDRAAQLAQARRLRVDDLPGGPALLESLVEALTHSLDADRAYAAWIRDELAGGCGTDSNHDAGNTASAAATVAKQQFVRLWNPIAAGYGLRLRQEGDI